MENNEHNKIEFTGERMINHPESLMYKVSLERYRFAANFVDGKDILDISCGSGYGSNYLAKMAKSVFGVDIDAGTVEYCKKKYIRNNLDFLCIEKDHKIESFENRFDVVVSLETIEHIKEYEYFLKNLKLYLKENGLLILSTPNNFRKINPPENRFHAYEFDILELYEIVKKLFPSHAISLHGQCQTNVRRSEAARKQISLRKAMQYIIKKIYDFDKKHLDTFKRLEHLKIYQYLSKIQGTFEGDISIYKINETEDFFNPLISVFVISKEKTVIW